MRIFGPALVLAVLAAACTTPVADPGSAPTPPEVSSTSAPTNVTTTTIPEAPSRLSLVLDEVEALAVDQGVRLEISDGAGMVLGWVDRENPELNVDSSIRRIEVRYLAPDGEPAGVIWEQRPEMPVTRIRQPWRGPGECAVTLPDGSTAPVALVWQSGGSSAEYAGQLDGADGGVTVVSPIWWRIDADGSVVSSADPGYVEAAHDRNVAVWPAVAGFDADTHHLVLSDPQRRSALARQISEAARAIGVDGVNIDIEGYRIEDSEAFLAWVEELAALVRDWGGVISYDLVPRSDYWDVTPEDLGYWSTAPLRTELSLATDCTVLMAYDEHNRYRPPGPVASPRWVEEILVHALRHTDPDQLVLGVSFYGRVWDPQDLERPTAMGIGDLERLIAEGEVTPDPAAGLDRVELADGRFFWAETTAGLEHRFDLVAGYGLAGWAAWRFGFDNPGIWELVGDRGS
ncbi:MAG TPA: glycosyl hydrolase family 18 protein [Acidimicrobiia bacterium]|nr:glycosyl hydrolase family 18 protein [Acidimicrobiia bacterium]